MPRRRLRSLALCLLLLALAGCAGSGGSGAISRPSLPASFSPTGGRPSFPPPTGSAPVGPTRTSPAPPTETSGPPGSTTPTPTSRPPSPEPTTEPTKPTKPTKTIKPTSGPTTVTPSTSAAPPSPPSSEPAGSSAEGPSSSTPAEDTGTSSAWWWLVLLVLLIAALVTWLLIRRARVRRAWGTALADSEQEVGWFARELVPQLRASGSPAGVAGGWAVAAPRIQALEDELGRLVTTAPGDPERSRALVLRDGVRAARERMAALLGQGESPLWSAALDEVQAPLLAALVPPGAGAPA